MSSDAVTTTPEGSTDADKVAAAVTAVPGVHDMHSGRLGEVATYLPGRRVPGVRLTPESTDVHVVLDWGAPVEGTAAAVRQAVRSLDLSLPAAVDVVIEDVADPSAS